MANVKCPHKGSPEWRKLVDNLGEQVAWKVFLSNDEGVPSMDVVDKIIEEYPKTSTKYTLKALNMLSSERGMKWMRANRGIFKKDKEQYWKKFQQDLQIPKAQVELIKEFETNDPADSISEFSSKYGPGRPATLFQLTPKQRLINKLSKEKNWMSLKPTVEYEGKMYHHVLNTDRNQHGDWQFRADKAKMGSLHEKNILYQNKLSFKDFPVVQTKYLPEKNKTIVIIDEPLLNSLDSNSQNQLNTTDKKVDNDLRQKLVTFLNRFGIDVVAVDNMLERTGQDAVAAADFINKLVLVANGKEDGNTLPEECAHFAIEMLMDHPFGKRIMQLIDKTEKFRQIEKEYGAAYNGDLIKLKKEAAGQLLRDVIHEQWTEYKSQNDLFRVLNKAWNWVKAQFRKLAFSEAEIALQEINKEIAKDIFTENLVRYNPEQLQKASGKLFQLAEESESMRSLKKSVEDAIDVTFKKITLYRNRGDVKFLKREELLLEKLKDSLAKDKTARGLLNFIGSVRYDLGDPKKKDRGIFKILYDLKNTPPTDPYELSVKLLKINSYVSSFENIVSDVKMTIESDNELLNDKNISKLLDELKIVESNIKTAKELVKLNSYPTIAAIMREFQGDRGLDKDGNAIEIDWEKALRESKTDISWAERLLDGMADAKDEVLQMIDKITKAFKEEARANSLKVLHDIVNETKLLEEAGFKPADVVAEKAHGKITGNWVTRYNIGLYHENLAKKSKEMKEQYNLSEDEKRPTDPKLVKQWRKDWHDWFKANTQTVPNVGDVMNAKYKELVTEHGERVGIEVYNRWLNDVREIRTDRNGGEYIIYKGELQIPSDKYLNKQFDEIQNSPAKKRYYDFMYNLHKESVKKLPEGIHNYMNYALPQVRKSYLERAKDRGVNAKGQLKELKTSFIEEFVRHEGDTEFGQYQLTDEKGQPANFIPVHFVSMLRNMDDLSLDISATVAKFYATSEEHHQMDKVIHSLELTKELLKSRRYEIRDSFGKLLRDPVKYFKDKDNRLLTDGGLASAVLERAESYFQMELYGHLKKDEGQLWKTGMDKAKVIDLFGRYVSLNNLAFNLYSGVSNITYGNTMLMQEGITGEYYNLKDLGWADLEYSKEMGTTGLLELGQRKKTNKLHLWNEFVDTFEDFNQKMRGLNLHSNSVLGQALDSDAFYAINSAGEHYLQSALSLALANTVRFNSEGKPVWKKDFKGNKETWDKMPNLYEVMEVKDGHLTAKKGYDVSAVRNLFKNRLSFINHSLNGIYNEADRSALQQYALGRLALQFRKFIKPGWNRRFREGAYYEAPELYREGFYYTAGDLLIGNFFRKIRANIEDRQYSYVAQFQNLNDHQKHNLIRFATEVGFMIASSIFLFALSKMGDDDDENWALNMLAYQANRYYTELRFWSSPTEALRILKSPAAGVTQLQNVLNLLDLTRSFDITEDGVELSVIKSGHDKGKTRLRKGLEQVVPFWRTIDRLQTPNEQLLFYK